MIPSAKVVGTFRRAVSIGASHCIVAAILATSLVAGEGDRRPSRVIYDSDAADLFIKIARPLRPENVCRQVDEVGATGVTALVTCPDLGQAVSDPTRVGETFGAKMTSDQPTQIAETGAAKTGSLEREAANIKAPVDAGDDPLGLAIELGDPTRLTGGPGHSADDLVLHSNWPQFRGPSGDGHSREVNLPIAWGPAKNVAWNTSLPGVGASSPVVWNGRIFLTATEDKGHKRLVICLDRSDGSIRWQRVVSTGDPGASHDLNHHASSTCVTDGQYVWSFFGKGGLFCHDLDGKLVWEQQLGEFLSMWGTAASPIVHGDKLIVNCDQDTVNEYYPPLDGPSKASLIALSKRTGATIWQTPRAASRGFSTPVVLRDPGGREQIVLNGPDGVRAYDPTTGRDLWRFQRTVLFGEPCVVAGHGLVFGLAGRDGPMAAIRDGGSGDVTESATAWTAPRQGRDVTSPLVMGDYLFTATMAGIATCYDARTGSVLWRERLGKGFAASFVAADGKIYLLARDGQTTIFEPGPQLKVVAVNGIDATGAEDFLASPAVSNGQIFIRSVRTLYCVGTPR